MDDSCRKTPKVVCSLAPVRTNTHRRTNTHKHDIFHSSICFWFFLFLPSVKKVHTTGLPLNGPPFCDDWGYLILLNQWSSEKNQQDHWDSEKSRSQVYTFPLSLKPSLRISFSKSFTHHYVCPSRDSIALNCSWFVASFPSQLYTCNFSIEI